MIAIRRKPFIGTAVVLLALSPACSVFVGWKDLQGGERCDGSCARDEDASDGAASDGDAGNDRAVDGEVSVTPNDSSAAGDSPADSVVDSPQDTGGMKPPGDSAVVDTSVQDSGTGVADTAPMACPANTPFTAPPWVTPTALHQNVCTTAQVQAWVSSQNMKTGVGASGNATCDACIVTPESAAAYGPVVTNSSGVAVELNVGGCVANEDGMAGDGSCGDQLNNQQECVDDECQSCTEPMFSGCEQAVLATGGTCATYLSSSCALELGDGGVQVCTQSPTVQTFLLLWCGP